MLGADIVASILSAEGVDFVVGFPENRVFDSAARVGIRPIIARTERVAVNIADGYTRMSSGKRVAVACVQHGPGAEAAMAAVAQAFGDGTPILLIASEYDRSEQDIAPNFRAEHVYSHITAWSATLNDWRKTGEVFRRAFGLLRNQARGPVLVAVANDLLYEEVGDPNLAYQKAPTLRSQADPKDVADALRTLMSAQRPVIVAGSGVRYAEAWTELRAFAEHINAPVVTTLNGKGVFPENHPLSLGAGGRSRPAPVDEFLAMADVVLGVGTSFTRSEYITSLPPTATIGQITANPGDIAKCYEVRFGCVGDAKLVLGQLLSVARHDGITRSAGWPATLTAQIARAREAFLRKWMSRLTSDERPISPYRVIWELMRSVDRSRTVVTHDAGNPRDQLTPFYESVVPRGYMGWGKSTQLGTGLGLMMGARLAEPTWLAVNVMGDAAFGMVGMDVETAVREDLPVLTVVLNNGLMGGYRHYMPAAIDRYQSNRLSGDYNAVGQALGAYVERVDDPSTLALAFRRCGDRVRDGQTALLEVLTREEPDVPIGGGL